MPLGHYHSPRLETLPGSAFIIGEALVDLVATPAGTATCRAPGGSPANVAVQLSHRGAAVAMTTRCGTDPAGDLLLDWFAEAGVGLLGKHRDDAPTNSAHVTTGAEDHYTFALHGVLPRRIPAVPDDTVVLHTGSLVMTDATAAGQVVSRIHQARATATISFDPNIRPDAISDVDATRQAVADCIHLADIVKLSEADARWLAPSTDPLDLVDTWLAEPDGPSLVILTAGADGLIGQTRHHVVAVPADPVHVVDTIGAGDSVTASVLHTLWQLGALGAENRQTLRELDWATVKRVAAQAVTAAGVTVSHAGATPVAAPALHRAADVSAGPVAPAMTPADKPADHAADAEPVAGVPAPRLSQQVDLTAAETAGAVTSTGRKPSGQGHA